MIDDFSGSSGILPAGLRRTRRVLAWKCFLFRAEVTLKVAVTIAVVVAGAFVAVSRDLHHSTAGLAIGLGIAAVLALVVRQFSEWRRRGVIASETIGALDGSLHACDLVAVDLGRVIEIISLQIHRFGWLAEVEGAEWWLFLEDTRERPVAAAPSTVCPRVLTLSVFRNEDWDYLLLVEGLPSSRAAEHLSLDTEEPARLLPGGAAWSLPRVTLLRADAASELLRLARTGFRGYVPDPVLEDGVAKLRGMLSNSENLDCLRR